ncbi:dTDP-4-dehydrorhamnose 3,5-epimerase [Rhodoblastus acidophilus]|uniref:dTDP-4-dehydrorhamnose 3,5-epimerase n=1 Tax=Rhodoblastus acidophilus TaxID=1074 RepID=UPI0022247121|nr:dTDP-4-dehydrorhamnose 3,5-epimerase [Rhodoblastus acidophilus]MCW2284373.1 dTDP-4-dehydrorhamnose 3,5-epimerase [Rhodoblastus acidophilus]MCW2333149.1 dTDP-4-dehydrorhamnose 3,5-epimerase [Rhodoblastus acidophilus]
MEHQTFEIAGPVLLTPKKFGDERGFFSETYNERVVAPLIGPQKFVQDNQSLSKPAGTLRGLHFQIDPMGQGKLVRVTRGAIFDVAVDLRRSSPTFGRHVAVTLSAENWRQFWIPVGFAHGFCTLEPDTEVVYKVTEYYAPECDRGLAFDDPALGIDWPRPAENYLLSPKDRTHPKLCDLPACFS